MDLRIFCFFQTNALFFVTFFKYYVVSQGQSEDCTCEDDIIVMIEVMVLQIMSLQYVRLAGPTQNIFKFYTFLPKFSNILPF